MKYKAALNELVELLNTEKRDNETSTETLKRVLDELKAFKSD